MYAQENRVALGLSPLVPPLNTWQASAVGALNLELFRTRWKVSSVRLGGLAIIDQLHVAQI